MVMPRPGALSNLCVVVLRLQVDVPAGHECGEKPIEPIHVDGFGHEDGALGQATSRFNFFGCQC